MLGAASRAVGLTGADAGVARVTKAPLHRGSTAASVDLGRVGNPWPADARGLLGVLLARGFVPVVACLGADEAGRLYNVNADTLAGHLAVACGARELLIGGATPGVLDRGRRHDRAARPRGPRPHGGRRHGVGRHGGQAGRRARAIAGGVGTVCIADGRTSDGLLGRRGTVIGGEGALQ